MSNPINGRHLGSAAADPRLDLTDLYAFPSPADPSRTVLALTLHPAATSWHPDAVYRLAIDNDSDLRNDIAFSFVFGEPDDGAATVDVYLAYNDDAEAEAAVGSRIFDDVEVAMDKTPVVHGSGSFKFFAGLRSNPFFVDFDGIQNLFDTSAGRNYTAPRLGPESPWTGVDANLRSNVLALVVEMPTSALGAVREARVWGRVSVRRDGKLVHVDRVGHPLVNGFFNTDETEAEYNAGIPRLDRQRWIGSFIHLLGQTGGYTRPKAIAALDNEGTLPDMLRYDPDRPAKYPNGRTLHDDVVDYRLAMLTNGKCPPQGLPPHTDTLDVFPYLGAPH